jgi:hypothetical protein
LTCKLLRDGDHAPFGKPVASSRSATSQDEHRVFVDLQRWVVDTVEHVVIALEHDGGSGMAEQSCRGGCGLENGTVGGEVAA